MSSPIEPRVLATASNAFGCQLYRAVAGGHDNLCISPASISSALAMVYAGARGETAIQLGATLRFPADAAQCAHAWGELQRALVAAPELTLRVANRLFGPLQYELEPAFVALLDTAYGASLERLDFAGDATAARTRINDWVADQTANRILDLIPEGGVSAATRLVVVNALYFLATWADEFESRLTRDEPFHVSARVTRVVPMMHRIDKLRIAAIHGGRARAVELPYAGSTMAMLVLLPDEVDGLAALEKSLRPESFEPVLHWTCDSRRVDLALPRFQIAGAALQLASALTELGMSRVFSDEADFTGIANPRSARDRVKIGDVFHKTFIKVDEQGTEAAAATATSMLPTGAPPPPIPFVVDRPFVFAIVDRESGLLLFVGRVADPTR